MTSQAVVNVVSGLPRSGTSLMMQMISAGGIPALTDHERAPDEDNPRGYLEFERVKQIKRDKTWLDDAAGKVVKLVHSLLYDLPAERRYRVVFMRRNAQEVLASQKRMLDRQGKRGAQMPDEQLMRTFEEQVNKVLRWAREQPHFSVLEVVYHELVADPASHARVINQFLGGGLDETAMMKAVDPGLYRNRANP